METLIASCPFCGKRHLIEIEDLDTWHAQCECGARGFIEDDSEVAENAHEGVGFTVHEAPNPSGTIVHIADPLPIFVDTPGSWMYVCWFKYDPRYM